jgi:hypothetical protein
MIDNVLVIWPACKVLIFLSDSDEPWIFSTSFRKNKKISNIKFQENLSSGNRAVPCRRTDRHDEANSYSSRLCERAPKNCNLPSNNDNKTRNRSNVFSSSEHNPRRVTTSLQNCRWQPIPCINLDRLKFLIVALLEIQVFQHVTPCRWIFSAFRRIVEPSSSGSSSLMSFAA